MNTSEIKSALNEMIASDYNGGYSYIDFCSEVERLFNNSLVTGPVQNPELLDYTRMNIVRMKRWDKHFEVRNGLKEKISSISGGYTWMVLTEGWCGDSAQILPQLNKMAMLNKGIPLVILLRDENPELMDEFLTNGTRSIPRLICLDANGKEVFSWGPRPARAIELMEELKKSADPVNTKEHIHEKLHLWYSKDKGESIQDEFEKLISLMN
ncbi:MAG: thioredoxin family protein [Crocinitomicaceae bacterium]|nr:thioredoxin family protein [Crocinitomicaceae bacterium]